MLGSFTIRRMRSARLLVGCLTAAARVAGALAPVVAAAATSLRQPDLAAELRAAEVMA